MAVQLTQSYHHLPLTITPILGGPTQQIHQQPQQHHVLQRALNPPQPQPPDLTFHCMCCAEFFVHPVALYQHMNALHPNEPSSEERRRREREEEEAGADEGEDYSWIFEPVCELAEEGGSDSSSDEDSSDSSGDDDSSDDDDSSSSSSSSNSSSSGTSSEAATSSNSNTQTQQAPPHPMRSLLAGPVPNEFHLQMADPRESTSIIMLQPSLSITPVNQPPPPPMPPMAVPLLPLLGPEASYTPIKRRRGRRSRANTTPMAMAVDPALNVTNPAAQKCFQCTQCESSFPNAGDLSKHVRSHITNKPFQCSICQKTFTHIGSLNTHIRIHSGEKPYKCEICPKAFTQSSSLMVHMRSHSVRKPHQCMECDKGFINYSSLLLHQKTHAAPTETFTCPECEREFKAEALLDEHMRMHTQELVYQCAICTEAFRASSELVQHMKNHLGEKPFTCSLCDRSFTQSGSLNIHMRIHTGEKPFQCKLCDKCFTQASSLSVHMKIHAGEKPYPCPICGKSYSQQAYLNKHIQAHQAAAAAGAPPSSTAPGYLLTKQQPHETLVCIVCGSLHADATALASHVTSQHAALLDTMKQCPPMPTAPTGGGAFQPEGKFSQEQQQAYMQRVQTVLQQMNQQQQIQQQQLQQPPLMLPPHQPQLPSMDSTGEDEEAEDPEEEEEEEEDETPEDEAEVEEEEAQKPLLNLRDPILGPQEEPLFMDADMYYEDFADMDVGCQEEVFGDYVLNEEEVYTQQLI